MKTWLEYDSIYCFEIRFPNGALRFMSTEQHNKIDQDDLLLIIEQFIILERSIESAME